MSDTHDDTTERDGSEDDAAVRLYRKIQQDQIHWAEPPSHFEKYLAEHKRMQYGVGNVSGSESESALLSAQSAQSRYEQIEGDRREALSERVKDENKLRNRLGNVLLVMVGVQLGISDFFLAIFMCVNPYSTTVMLAWLSACVIEVIGLVWVITRSIFPFKDGYRDTKAEDMSWPGRISQQTDVKTSQTIDSTED